MPSACSSAWRVVARAGSVAALLDPGASLARVAGQEPGELLRRDDLRLAQHGALEELGEALAVGGGRLAGLRGERPELGLARRQRVAFERRRACPRRRSPPARTRGSW